MMKTNSTSSDFQVNRFGIKLTETECQKLDKRLDLLKEKLPYNSQVELSFEKRKSAIVGRMTVTTINKEFYSRKIGFTPLQTYLSLEEDIEEQLMQWKRERFSLNFTDSIFNSKVQSA